MATILSDDTIRRRDVRLKLEWADLRKLIALAVQEMCVADHVDMDTVQFEVEMKQEERGSPSYRIGEWSAIVKVTHPID